MKTIIDAGADVGIIQIGNETNSAMAGEKDWAFRMPEWIMISLAYPTMRFGTEPWTINDAGLYYGGCSWDNQAMFDFNGKALPSLNVFKYLYHGSR